jgi:hypothetical protein
MSFMVEVMTPLVSVKQLGDASMSSLTLSWSALEVDLEAMSGDFVEDPRLNRRMKGCDDGLFCDCRDVS